VKQPSATKSTLSVSTPTSVTTYGHDLVNELMGEVDFGQMTFLALCGRLPDPSESRVINALLVTLVEHGLTPSTIAARLTYLGAPDGLQGAVAAGVLGLGSVVVGSIGEAARMLREVVHTAQSSDMGAVAAIAVDTYLERRETIPGLGHMLHKPVDPRAERLFTIAEEEGLYGEHCRAVRLIRDAAQVATSKLLPVNATGAIAAVGLELGLGEVQCGGLGIIARTAGLVAHVAEEAAQPIAIDVWRTTEGNHTGHESNEQTEEHVTSDI